MADGAFGEEWKRKQTILDDSFRFMAHGLTRIGKRIGEAFIAFVDQKFSFKEPFYYVDADGSE
jgi:hypothetical protein